MKPRKHHEVIRAWADGAEVQYRLDASAQWKDSDTPAFVDDCEYRVKPAREYPKSKMGERELLAAVRINAPQLVSFINLADAALRHAIDHGQVVTREEFDSAIGDRAMRDLNVSVAVRDAAAKLPEIADDRHVAARMIRNLDLFALIDGVKP